MTLCFETVQITFWKIRLNLLTQLWGKAILPQIRLFMASDLSSFVDVSAEDIPKSILVSGITPEPNEKLLSFTFSSINMMMDDWKLKTRLMQHRIFA